MLGTPQKKPAHGGLWFGRRKPQSAAPPRSRQTLGTGVPELTHSAMFSALMAVL